MLLETLRPRRKATTATINTPNAKLLINVIQINKILFVLLLL